MNEFPQSPHLTPQSKLDYKHPTKEEKYHRSNKCPSLELTYTILHPCAGPCCFWVLTVCLTSFLKTPTAPQVWGEHGHSHFEGHCCQGNYGLCFPRPTALPLLSAAMSSRQLLEASTLGHALPPTQGCTTPAPCQAQVQVLRAQRRIQIKVKCVMALEKLGDSILKLAASYGI